MTIFKQPVENETSDGCIICLDDNVKECSLKLSDAIYQLNFLNICSCSCNVHIKCADEWFNISPKCPICRTKLKKNYKNPINLLVNLRRRQLNRENAKHMMFIILTPLYVAMHLIIFYVFTFTIARITCSVIVNLIK